MTHQEASAVVSLPLPEVEAKLRDVEGWSQFLIGVERIVKTSFERYTFTVLDDRRAREIEVCAIVHPREHRFSWKALAGPRFDGELRLHAVDERLTRVHLTMTAEPAGLLAGLTEMLKSPESTAALDLQRMESFLGTAVEAGGV